MITVFNLTQVPNQYCCALGALRKCAYFLIPVLPHCGGMSCAHSQHHVTDSSDGFMAQEQNSAHPFLHQLAEPMEPIHAELLRLATELEAVKGQTECNALRDLFARTTTALSSSGSQHDRRLNHWEAGRHLPQQFGGSRLDDGDFAFRMEGGSPVT